LGYRVKNDQLVVDAGESTIVQEIFTRYGNQESVTALIRELRSVHLFQLVEAAGIVSSLASPARQAGAALGHPRPLGAVSMIANPPNKKGATLAGHPFVIWWRRRELNPRPPALCHWLYMLRFR
jgi:hypothetical protein